MQGTNPEESLSASDHASYHAAMCLAEAVAKIKRVCERDFPTNTPIEIVERIQEIRKFSELVLKMTNDAIDIAGTRP